MAGFADISIKAMHWHLVGLKPVGILLGLGMPLGDAQLARLGDDDLLAQPCLVDGVTDGGIGFARARRG